MKSSAMISPFVSPRPPNRAGIGPDTSRAQDRFFDACDLWVLDLKESLRHLELGHRDEDTFGQIADAAFAIKEGAEAFGLHQIAEIMRIVEDLFDEALRGQRPVDDKVVNVAWRSVHLVVRLVAGHRHGDSTSH